MTLLGFLWTAIPSLLIGFTAGVSLRPRRHSISVHAPPRDPDIDAAVRGDA